MSSTLLGLDGVTRRSDLCGAHGAGALALVMVGVSRMRFIEEIEAAVKHGTQSSAARHPAAGRYFAGKRQVVDVSVDLRGLLRFNEPCCRRRNRFLLVRSALTAKWRRPSASRGAARAVGRALGLNPVSVVIPCHRVIGADGGLHGYSGAGGLSTKRFLLELEGYRRR